MKRRRFGVFEIVAIPCAVIGWFAISRCQPFFVHAPGTSFSHTDATSGGPGALEITRDGVYLGRVRSGDYILHDARIERFGLMGYSSYSIKGNLVGGGSNSPISIYRAVVTIDGDDVDLEATHILGGPTRVGTFRRRRSVSQESITVSLPRSIHARLASAESVALKLIGLRDETGVIRFTSRQVEATNEHMTKIIESAVAEESAEP